eukprot:scaffold14974_cov195-Amphora_coffeaeformis.AAC.26
MFVSIFLHAFVDHRQHSLDPLVHMLHRRVILDLNESLVHPSASHIVGLYFVENGYMQTLDRS